MRQGLKLSREGELRELLESRQSSLKQSIQSMKINLLDKVPNGRGWTNHNSVVDNVEAAVDNQIENIIIDAINEYSSLKKNLYKEMVGINKEIDDSGALSSRRKPNDPEEVNVLDKYDEVYDITGSRTLRASESGNW